MISHFTFLKTLYGYVKELNIPFTFTTFKNDRLIEQLHETIANYNLLDWIYGKNTFQKTLVIV